MLDELQVGDEQKVDVPEQVAGVDDVVQKEEEQVKEENLPFHEHPRWKEREEKFKLLEAELAEFKQAQQSKADESKPDPLKPTIDELIKLGFGEEQAAAMAKIMLQTATGVMAPVQEKLSASDFDQRFITFSQKHKEDIEAISPVMDKIYSSMSKEMQKSISADKSGLEYLYKLAKMETGNDFEKGKEAAIKKRDEKIKGGNIGNGSKLSGKGQKITLEFINSIKTPEEWEKHKDAIYAAQSSGELQ